MRATGTDRQIHRYGGVAHSFTQPHASLAGIPGIADDQCAADHTWDAMRTVRTSNVLASR